MDKFEYKVRAEEIKALIAAGEYEEAARIADTIDWRRVKSAMMLCTISDLYKINRRYEDSRDILLLAYERHAGGRLIVYSLCELSIKLGEYVQAIEYCKEYAQLAPNDSGRYILQYKLYEAQEASIEERIGVLEELKRRDYREKWAYELALLYHKVGLESKCVSECDEIYLWFGEGKYVLKAMELKQLHQPLTEEQQGKYEQMKLTGGRLIRENTAKEESLGEEQDVQAVEEADEDEEEAGIEQSILRYPTQEIPNEEVEDDIQVKTVDVSQYNTLNLQRELAESMKAFLSDQTSEQTPENQVKDQSKDQMKGQMKNQAKDQIKNQMKAQAPQDEETEAEDDEEIESGFVPVKSRESIDISRNLQAEALHNMQAELKNGAQTALSAKFAKEAESEKETPVSEEVFFGNTEEVNIENVVSELVKKDAGASVPSAASAGSAETQPAKGQLEKKQAEKAGPAETQSETPAAEEKLSAKESMGQASDKRQADGPYASISNTGIIKTFHKPSGYDNLLSQEYDGQIRLVVPEQEKVEKQITGQLSISDVMAEWEKIKKDKEQKMMEEIRERVHKQTDALFADFDESTKSGLLEELEKAMVDAAIKENKKKAAAERPKVVKFSDLGKEKAKSLAKEEEEKAAASSLEELSVAEEAELEEEAEERLNEDEIEETEETEEIDEIEEIGEEKDAADEEIEEPDDTEDEPEPDEEEPDENGETDVTEETDETAEPAPSKPTLKKRKPAKAKNKTEQDAAEQDAAEQDKEDSGINGAAAREMTRSEREQFAPFIHHKKTRKQIVEILDNISMASYMSNVVVTGEEGTGTTALAKLLIKEVQLADSNFSGKVAKISGSNLNKKDVSATLSRLSGGALIIENAAAMKKMTVDSLARELDQEDKGMIIFLEDKKGAMDKFLAKHAALAPIFSLRVDVEALDDQTLVKYARKYALEQEYSIDDLGVLALHTRIADMQTSDHEVTLAEIEELVDEAIYYADKKNPKHFFDILVGKRYDEEDMIVLREKDFMHY